MKTLLVIGMIAFSLSSCNLSNKNQNGNNTGSGNGETSNNNNAGTTSSPSSTPSLDSGPAEKPNPTAAQTASVAKGLAVTWKDHGMHWMVPTTWKEGLPQPFFLYEAPTEHTTLIVNSKEVPNDLAVAANLISLYTTKNAELEAGKLEELRRLELDGVKGVQWREIGGDATYPKRLVWVGYRKYQGKLQYVTISLSTDTPKFRHYQDAFYGILYSTRIDK